MNDDDKVRHLYSAADAARLGIPPATVRVWAHRKRIYHYGLDERGRRLYDRDDLVRLRDASKPKEAAA